MNESRKVLSYLFAGIAFTCSVIAEKWGIARGKVPETISWQEFFSERLDTVFIFTIIGYAIGYLFYRSLSGDEKYSICVNCQTTVASKTNNTLNCANCNGTLEPLKGFYVRHPELKDNK